MTAPAFDAIVAELAREARRRRFAAAVSVAAVFAVSLLLARQPLAWAQDGVTALGLLAVALASAVAGASRGVAMGATMLAPAAVLGVGLLTGHAGGLHARVGTECAALELACGAVVMGAAWMALRWGSTSLGARAAACCSAAGATAGAAALELTCPVRGSLEHLAAFHFGGVLMALLGAAMLCRRAPRAGDATSDRAA